MLPADDFFDLCESLKRLGMSSYSQYLRSPIWASVKARLKSQSDSRACFICGGVATAWHHKNYKHMGAEKLGFDVDMVCVLHHGQIHKSHWKVERGKTVQTATQAASDDFLIWSSRNENRNPRIVEAQARSGFEVKHFTNRTKYMDADEWGARRKKRLSNLSRSIH